jgi:sugar/nucleoside kinase (ribokinase family)
VGFKIGVLGPINIDLILQGNAPQEMDALRKWSGPSDVHCLLAGAAGYVSQDLKKLGNDIHLVTCLSDDPFGDLLRNALVKAGISTKHVVTEPGTQSAMAIFLLLFGDKKRPLTFRLPTHHGWPPALTPAARKFLLDANLLHCCGYLHFTDLWTDQVPLLLKEAKKKDLLTSLDPQFPLTPLEPPWIKVLDPLLPHLDVLFVDESEAVNITGTNTSEDAVELLAKRVPTVVIKLGERGVLILNKNTQHHIPAVPPKKFCDSIGAGDAFDAGFLQGMLEGMPVEKAGKIGAITASMSLEGSGGSETFPTRGDLSQIFR